MVWPVAIQDALPTVTPLTVLFTAGCVKDAVVVV
jgi:hypothetical protein